MQYKILYPEAFPVVSVSLQKGEAIKAESGAMIAIRFRGAGTPRLASERSATSSFHPKTNPVLCRTILHFFAGA